MSGRRWTLIILAALCSCGGGQAEAPTTTALPTTTVDPVVRAIGQGYVALCRNGDYSDNTDFAKTCSGGGGILQWLGPFGRCTDGHIVAMSEETSCDDHGGFETVMPPDFTPEPGPADLARCQNGTYSDNQDLDRTCSSNGGVAEWLAPYATCEDETVIELRPGNGCGDHGGIARLSQSPPSTSEPTETVTGPSSSPSTTGTAQTTVDPVDEAIATGHVALCNDGGFSDNTDFYATCSGGGGVDRWLAPYGICVDGTIIAMNRDASCRDHGGFKELLAADYVPTAQLGDIAKCTDGTFSHETSLDDTCSNAGGVEAWLAPYGTCIDGTFVVLGTNASCDDHGGFAALLPVDYLPTVQDLVTTNVDMTLTTGELVSVESTGTAVTVTVRSSTGPTEGLTKDAGRFAVATALQGVQQSNLPPEVEQITVRVLYDLVDPYGEVAEELVIEASYTRPTLDRIIFTNIDQRMILTIADAYLYVHPSFAKGDGS